MSIYYLKQLPKEHSEYFLQNKYTKWYFNIISKALTRGLKKPRRDDSDYVYYEAHHILPKAKHMFKQYANLNNNKWNSVLLTAKEHYVCHLLLIKMTTKQARENMKTALQMLQIFPKSVTERYCSKNYNFFVEKFQITQLGNKHGIGNKAHKGRIFSKTHLKKLSDAHKGCNNPNFGGGQFMKNYSWYNNGIESVYCLKNQQPEGFQKGRITGWNTHPKK